MLYLRNNSKIDLTVEFAFRVCENRVDAPNDLTSNVSMLNYAKHSLSVIVPSRTTKKTSELNTFVLQCKQEYYILVCTVILIGMYADERF